MTGAVSHAPPIVHGMLFTASDDELHVVPLKKIIEIPPSVFRSCTWGCNLVQTVQYEDQAALALEPFQVSRMLPQRKIGLDVLH
mmetsp:Transcript_129887/g.224562  ORF Transcript_129887/g.224562 Transcript_129887/m.224562 type:complete len:84 (+) Transcript_129887:1272-1523(+)